MNRQPTALAPSADHPPFAPGRLLLAERAVRPRAVLVRQQHSEHGAAGVAQVVVRRRLGAARRSHHLRRRPGRGGPQGARQAAHWCEDVAVCMQNSFIHCRAAGNAMLSAASASAPARVNTFPDGLIAGQQTNARRSKAQIEQADIGEAGGFRVGLCFGMSLLWDRVISR